MRWFTPVRVVSAELNPDTAAITDHPGTRSDRGVGRPVEITQGPLTNRSAIPVIDVLLALKDQLRRRIPQPVAVGGDEINPDCAIVNGFTALSIWVKRLRAPLSTSSR